MEFLGCFLMGY
ncbi:hypothetical protein F383_15220 [Gossypium arboreum]|uniref:Uncharacterized protein n=1 Tax=Gossypium arboreum TaxID=29729 RepID=A0A0B0NIW4_GOSAR|nr:hypothetical protein F383_15220 [Gossypium arboreum]